MELNQLSCFLQAAKIEHITQAAEQLHMTQPALSKVIARLEDDLGVRLFDREGKHIRLNEYGQVALRYTEQILYTIGDMQAELEEMADGRAGSVRVGSAFPAGEPNWMLNCTRGFALERPDVSFRLRQYDSRKLRAALENREIDLAISTIPLQGERICWQELFVERMGIILSRYHPLADRPTLSLSDLRKERFYCNNANSDVQELTYVFCERAGFRPNVHFECEFASFIGEAVSLGYGISLISERGYLQSMRKPHRKAWEDNIAFRPLEEEYCRRFCGVAYLEDRRLPRAAQAFYEYLTNHREEGGQVL